MIWCQIETSAGELVSRPGPLPPSIARQLARKLAGMYRRNMFVRDIRTDDVVYGVMV